MTTLHLTDQQRDTFAACGIIVLDGERWQGDCELCDNARAVFDRWETNAIVGRHEIYKPCPQCATTQGEAAWVAPEGWRILTEPCDTCHGWGFGRKGEPYAGRKNPRELKVRLGPCPDCVGGRRVVTLTATCPKCLGSCCDSPCLAAHPDDGRPHNPCPTCGREGDVTLGRFTIPALLPVYAWNSQPKITHPCVEVAPHGCCQVWDRNDRWRPDDPSSCEFTHIGFGGTEWTKTSTLAHPPRPGQFIARPERVA